MLRTTLRLLLLLGFSAFFGVRSVRADHFGGATISYDCLGSNQYRVTLDMYLNCAGTAITPQTLLFASSCGTSFSIVNLNPVSITDVSPLCPSQLPNSTCNGGSLIGFRRYRFQTTSLYLSPCNFWKIEWSICCRNPTVNIAGTPGMYVITTLNNSGGFCDNSPRFVDNGIPFVCVNQTASYNPGVSDPDGHTMTFALISARYASPTPTAVTYQGGYTAAVPASGMTINPNTGQLSFTPTVTGFYVVVIEVTSYRSNGLLIGKVMRDLMFSVNVCDGNPPSTTGISSGTNGVFFWPNQFIVCNGQSFCVNLVFTDPQPATVITVQSNVTSVLTGSTFTFTGTNPVTATLCWTGNESMLPLNVWFLASDNNCPIANTVSTAVTAISCVYLPMELVRFDARSQPDNVSLNWTMASETDVREYTVERSQDGTTYTTVGRVPSDGNTQQLRDYALTDVHPLEGIGYYRLRQTDLDGTNTYSSVVSVHRSDNGRITAYFDGSTWTLQGVADERSWILMDGLGRRMDNGPTDPGRMNTIPPCASGSCMLIVQDTTHRYLIKLPVAPEPGTTVASGIAIN